MAHPKSSLIERCQTFSLGKPDFKTKNTQADHKPLFICDIYIQGQHIATGEGKLKKDAERQASKHALTYLDATENKISSSLSINNQPFEGPWPIFPEVLAASLHVAHNRTKDSLKGKESLNEIKDAALYLYKELLENLGEVVEVDDVKASDKN